MRMGWGSWSRVIHRVKSESSQKAERTVFEAKKTKLGGLRLEAGPWQAAPWGLSHEMLLLRGAGSRCFPQVNPPEPPEEESGTRSLWGPEQRKD